MSAGTPARRSQPRLVCHQRWPRAVSPPDPGTPAEHPSCPPRRPGPDPRRRRRRPGSPRQSPRPRFGAHSRPAMSLRNRPRVRTGKPAARPTDAACRPRSCLRASDLCRHPASIGDGRPDARSRRTSPAPDRSAIVAGRSSARTAGSSPAGGIETSTTAIHASNVLVLLAYPILTSAERQGRLEEIFTSAGRRIAPVGRPRDIASCLSPSPTRGVTRIGSGQKRRSPNQREGY